MILPCLFIVESAGKGRGVFTREIILADTVIEIAPVIVMPKNDRQYLDKTLLHDYIFEWGDDEEQSCIGLGMISIYNHSYQSNCDYFMDYDEQTMMIKTVRPIIAGEEITINYNGDWNNEKKIWFDVK
ncbi:MAG: SET domain-containing protein [Ferruginibacter sp.]|nr:SET domain-containing protein [Ferruginibacter sp.]